MRKSTRPELHHLATLHKGERSAFLLLLENAVVGISYLTWRQRRSGGRSFPHPAELIGALISAYPFFTELGVHML
eukprot:2366824-Pleurochrysis_carterae.AAC.2